MLPAHLARDDFVAVGMIHVFFEKLHVTLGLAVLLLEETLPLVFVPDALGLMLLVFVGHKIAVTNQRSRIVQKVCLNKRERHRPGGIRLHAAGTAALREAASSSSRWVWSRSWPHAASMSWPFSRRIVASTPALFKIPKNA